MTNKRIRLLSLATIAAGALVFSACGDNGSSASADDDQTTSNALVLVFGSDYSSGELRWMNPGDTALSSKSLTFYEDSRLVAHGQYLYVLERAGGDNIDLVDLSKISEGSDAVLKQVKLASGANPSALVFVNDTIAWLSQEGAPFILKINPNTLKHLDSISTDKFTLSGNLSPDLVDMKLAHDTLITLMDRLDQYSPTVPGLIALYNATSGKLLDTIPLTTENPSAMALYDGSLWVTTRGPYNSNYGLDADAKRGLEKVNLSSKKASMVVTGKAFGGGLSGIVLDSATGIAYIPVYESYGNVPLAAYNFKAETVTLLDSIADAEGSLAFDSETGKLFMGDRSYGSEKLYVYQDGMISEINSGSALAPYGIAVARW